MIKMSQLTAIRQRSRVDSKVPRQDEAFDGKRGRVAELVDSVIAAKTSSSHSERYLHHEDKKTCHDRQRHGLVRRHKASVFIVNPHQLICLHHN